MAPSTFPFYDMQVTDCLAYGAATVTALAAYAYMRPSAPADMQAHHLKSPLTTVVPSLSAQELSEIPYPPDSLPGARDVDTPYGNIRVYEWGPEEGRKVLLVHGISTPCLSLASIALKLVAKGCRVMMFDLFGRGYSDAPQGVRHDARLYTTQILLCLASSPLPWTGDNGFSLIGYSLGGGISAVFTSYLPNLVSSLVLIAPSGLIRDYHIGWSSKILYRSEGILPDGLIHWLVRRRLRAGPIVSAKTTDENETEGTVKAADALAAEAGGKIPSSKPGTASSSSSATNEQEKSNGSSRVRSASISGDGASPVFSDRPQITVPASVAWQIDNHPGFIQAFTSAIRYAPITGCHSLWNRIGERLTAQKQSSSSSSSSSTSSSLSSPTTATHPTRKSANQKSQGLENSKVLIILGKTDPIIVFDEIKQDATEAFGGEENVEVVAIDAGHELPVNKPREITDVICGFWGISAGTRSGGVGVGAVGGVGESGVLV